MDAPTSAVSAVGLLVHVDVAEVWSLVGTPPFGILTPNVDVIFALQHGAIGEPRYIALSLIAETSSLNVDRTSSSAGSAIRYLLKKFCNS